jgi:hypothetical protein
MGSVYVYVHELLWADSTTASPAIHRAAYLHMTLSAEGNGTNTTWKRLYNPPSFDRGLVFRYADTDALKRQGWKDNPDSAIPMIIGTMVPLLQQHLLDNSGCKQDVIFSVCPISVGGRIEEDVCRIVIGNFPNGLTPQPNVDPGCWNVTNSRNELSKIIDEGFKQAL